MKTVKLTDGEVRALQVAVRLSIGVNTDLVGMSPDKDMRRVFMRELQLLHTAGQKLA